MGRYILRAMLNFQGVHGFDVINQRHPLLDHSEYASVCIHPCAQIAGDFQYLVLEISNMYMFGSNWMRTFLCLQRFGERPMECLKAPYLQSKPHVLIFSL